MSFLNRSLTDKTFTLSDGSLVSSGVHYGVLTAPQLKPECPKYEYAVCALIILHQNELR